ncbi:hypothetical protein MMC11_006641 [Xylographa trunciseda]|nr:hypothetical protein [Xylographa trunciseda]
MMWSTDSHRSRIGIPDDSVIASTGERRDSDQTLASLEVAPKLQEAAMGHEPYKKLRMSVDDPAEPQDMEKQERTVDEKAADVASDETPTTNVVTWDGPNDPANPLNWPQRKKWAVTLLCSMSGLITLMSGTMMAPALSNIGSDLHLGDAAVQLTLSIYVLAYAFGPLILAPTTEIYGRRPVWLASGTFYLIFNTVCGFSQNNATMIAARFLAGIGASAEFAVTNPVLADCWAPEQRGHSLSISTFVPLLGTAIGPIIGGVITEYIGWRWLFWIVSIFSGLITLTGFFLFSEPFHAKILSRKAAALRKAGAHDYYTEHERRSTTVWQKVKITLTRPILMLATQPTLQIMSLFMAFNFGINYILLSTYAELWTQRYGQTQAESGYHYVTLAIGNTLASQVGARITDRVWAALKRRAGGITAPEYRVPMMIPGSLLIPIGLFWYGWAAESRVFWLVTDIGAAIFACGIILAVQSMQAYVLDSFPGYTASATAASQFLRSITAFVFPIFAPAMYQALGYGWANSLLGFLGLMIGVPAPLLLWRYGARLRAAGKPQW